MVLLTIILLIAGIVLGETAIRLSGWPVSMKARISIDIAFAVLGWLIIFMALLVLLCRWLYKTVKHIPALA